MTPIGTPLTNRLRDAILGERSTRLREDMASAADQLEMAVREFARQPTTENLQHVNCLWSRGERLLGPDVREEAEGVVA